jgi:hypothetical protein
VIGFKRQLSSEAAIRLIQSGLAAMRRNLDHLIDPPSIPEAAVVHLANHGVVDG